MKILDKCLPVGGECPLEICILDIKEIPSSSAAASVRTDRASDAGEWWKVGA